MAKIGLYGGTFNPIHEAHVHLVKDFADRLGLDKVLLMPTFQPPHKQAHQLASPEDRMAMCRLAAAGDERIQVSDLEIRRAGKSYTAETLEELHRLYPGNQWHLLMGEDMFLTIDRWYRPETIYRLAVLCAAPRSPDGLPRLEKHAQFLRTWGAETVLCDIRYLPVSSTLVREAVAAGKPLDGLVSPGIARYIREKGLYRDKEGNPS
ncbi:MAG TPA: nicotinate (nicotinamide) nucleotide adenylyltransferase [Candidatus Gallacutalibacter pullistercoris]|nr:nicotinate (nicotinamide) nucleotide adenylyltransferase [Candidatus Gallacutalibacter pullistercoris]